MALSSVSQFASYDITDGSQIRDISPVLQKALLFDLHLMGRLKNNIAWDDPADDVIIYWNEDALNPDTITLAASATSTATSLTATSGHGLRCHVGDYLKSNLAGSTEILQITAVSTDTLTVVRTINSTVAASIATSETLSLQRVEQEASDIEADATVAPTVRSNPTQIIAGKFGVQISGSQLMRQMATDALKDQVAHQLANRAIEFNRSLTRSLLYSERITPASDTAYRSFGGARYWIRDNGGVTSSSNTALVMLGSAATTVDSLNKTIVDLGVYPDLFVVPTGLVNSVNTTDASNRRMAESESGAGYMVQRVMLAQGNEVDILVDSRVDPGDAFLLSSERIIPKPAMGRGLFTIAATDFSDARKRRILGEWSLEFRNPSCHAYLSQRT